MSQSGLNFDIRGNWMGGPALNRMNGDLRRARGNIDATSLAGKRFSEALGGSSWRRQVQQAGMQISDFSVQVAGGQSAILAFTQNAPQFIQNFGAMGGVIAAVVTIAGTFAFAASRMGESVKALTEETDETVKGLDEYYTAMQRLDPVAYEVFEKAAKAIKNTSTEAKRLFELAGASAVAELAQDMEAFGSAFNENVSAKWIKSTAKELSEFLGVAKEVSVVLAPSGPLSNAVTGMRTNPQITAALGAFEAVADSANKTTSDQIAALENLHGVILSIVGSYDQADTAQRQLLTSINQAIIRAKEFAAAEAASAQAQQNAAKAMQATQLRYSRSRTAAGQAYNAILTEQAALIARGTSAANAFANTLDNEALAAMIKTFEASKKLREELGDAAFEALRLAGVDITSGVDAAAKAAAQLSVELGVAFEIAQKMQRMGVDVVQRSRVREGIASGAIPPQAGQDVLSETDMIRREQANERNKLRETIRDMRASATRNAAKTAGGGRGKSASQEVDEELREIQTRFEQTRDVISQSMLGSFKSLLDGTKSLGESVRDILGSIVDKVIDLLMTPIFNNIAGGIAGGLSGVIGGLGGNLGIGSFEGGGFTGSGPRAGGLDGRGGRLAMVHPNESIYDHTRGQGGGGVTVNMTVVTQDAPSFQKSRRQIERGLASAMQRGAAA